MTRSITKLFAVALTLTTISLTGTVEAGGCHSGGGGYGGGFGGYSAPSFPSYRRPPSYSSRPRVIENRPAPQSRTQPREQFQGQQQAQQPQQQIQQQQPQQQQSQQQPQQQARSQAPTQNGLNALGGNQQQAQAPTQQKSAEQTALQALAGMGGGEAQPQQQPQVENQPQQSQQPQASNGTAGTFVAKVGDKANVRLELRTDGNFTWTATRDGKTSSFSGTYSTDDGKLTLTRNDSQSLAGAMTVNTNGFNFKLDGAKDNGLTFARA